MDLKIETRPVDRLIPYVRNARTHSEEQVSQIAASIAEFGFVNPLLIGADDMVVAGHGRLLAARRLGMTEVPVVVLDHLSEAQRRALVIADNKIAENAGWDEQLLRAELATLREQDFDLDLLGFAEAELGTLLDAIDVDTGAAETQSGAPSTEGNPPSQTLAERFGIPPFSVLNAREGWWQNRKRAWIDLGIRSELGRGAPIGGAPMPIDRAKSNETASFRDQDKLNAIQAQKRGKPTAAPGGSPLPAADYSKSKARGDGRGKAIGDA
ncbi:MAG TPA: ParB/Srx family N-terminal domain-containing protein [Pseudolabrys sp.]|nr:ParB/Srx family N-terminal domain-containing protein [Pseudolabrys sp.]